MEYDKTTKLEDIASTLGTIAIVLVCIGLMLWIYSQDLNRIFESSKQRIINGD